MSNHGRLTLILTGAGASCGCEHVYPKQPPLSNQLFDELAGSFPYSWGRIAGIQAAQFRQNFEEGMDAIWQYHSQIVPLLMQDMAIYFSQFRPDGSFLDLYSQLLMYILSNNMEERMIFSTINYECILELAVSSLGLQIDYFSDKPSSKEKITLWKLHGSCNFMPKGINATRGVVYTAGVQFNTGIEPIQPNQIHTFCRSNTVLYPAMSVFARGKPMQICPQIIQTLQKIWANCVARAEVVAIIGVNPNPYDAHIWYRLATTDARILCIGNQERFENWRRQFRASKNSVWLTDKFQNGFKDLLAIINQE